MVVSGYTWSELTPYSCFTAENANSNFAIEYNVLKPFPIQHRRRLEVPRGALIFLIATCSEYIAESFCLDLHT